ncbi:MAG TPA: Arc family DNA-binding protein [Gaiellaceae bacterium]|nr:Arc family DNA-binding protein [Gaiellaceae bacterium]
MANFHLRDIPEPTYRRLQGRAKKAGRSVNKELLAIVEKELARATPEEVDGELDRLRRTIRLSPDAPRPEDLIREAREATDAVLVTADRRLAAGATRSELLD